MFKKLTVLAALVATHLFSQAAEVSVSKLRINLENGQTADFLNLNNQSKTNKEAFEITVQKWTQKDTSGEQKVPEEVLENTDDIIISPKTLVVLPNQDKVIRLIVNNPEAAKKNYSYRIILNQLPNKELGSSTNTVNLLFKISLPVFVYSDPIKTADKMAVTHSITTEGGKRFITIKNSDTQHIQISSLNIGEQKFSSSQYLLPGISSKIEIPADIKLDNLAANPLEIVTDKGSIKVTK